MTRRMVLVGAFQEMVELCETCDVEIAGIFDEHVQGEFMGHKILGRDEDARRLADLLRDVPVLIVPDSPSTRRRLAGYYLSLGYRPGSLVSPRAVISKSASIGPGTVVQSCCPHLDVSAHRGICEGERRRKPHARLGRRGLYDHRAERGGPRAGVSAGRREGANATLLPDIEVGEEAIVGAGAVVTRNVASRALVIGIPARPKGAS